MKALIVTVIGLILILLASYATMSYEPASYKLKTFVIEGSKENTETNYHNMKTFVIGQKLSGRAVLMHTKKHTRSARERNLMYQQRDEEIDKCIKKITKNWKRTYYKSSYNKYYDEDEEKWMHEDWSPFYEKEKEFHGYDEDEDFWFKWRLRNRALDGKKVC